jgi:hypothetical protein
MTNLAGINNYTLICSPPERGITRRVDFIGIDIIALSTANSYFILTRFLNGIYHHTLRWSGPVTPVGALQMYGPHYLVGTGSAATDYDIRISPLFSTVTTGECAVHYVDY